MEIKQGQIIFVSENSIGKQNQIGENPVYSGIGLENVKKRLNLLFQGKHELSISQDPHIFRIELMINQRNIKA